MDKLSKADARSICSKVTSLERSRKAGLAPEPAVLDWLNKLDSKLKAKLAKADLIDVDDRLTVQQVFDRVIELSDVKASTLITNRKVFSSFTDMFGYKLVENLTEDDLLKYRQSLDRMTPLTRFTYFMKIRGSLNKAKGFDKTLFNNVRVAKPKVDFAKREFIERDEIREVIEKVDIEYGAFLACGGLLGMRCRSEPEALRWENINFEQGFITVPAVKTASRITPIYADAATVLRKYHEHQGSPSNGLVFPTLPVQSTLHVRFEKAFGRKVKKPHQRLRSSCESYLVNDAGFAITDVSRWLGHDPATAMKFYNQSTPATFERAMLVGA